MQLVQVSSFLFLCSASTGAINALLSKGCVNVIVDFLSLSNNINTNTSKIDL